MKTAAPINTGEEEGHSKLWLVGLALSYLITNLINNVGVQQMGYYMPIYSGFLLYGPTFLYTIIFFCIAIVRGELNKHSLSILKKQQRYVWMLGFFTAFNGIFAQISIPFVSPEMTALITQVSTPVTWVAYPIMVRSEDTKPTVVKLFSFAVILFGLLFGGIYSYLHGAGNDNAYKNGVWIIVALLSALPTSFETIYQEKAYREEGMPIFLTLTLYNLCSFIPYFFWMFTTLTPTFGTCVDAVLPEYFECANNVTACTLPQMWQQQGDAVKCFFGNYSTECCGPVLSTVWFCVFVAGYVLSFATSAFILKQPEGANIVANLNALTTPFVGMFFWIPTISGPSQSNFEWWILLSFLIIAAGNLVYSNFGNLEAKWNKRLLLEDEEKQSLVTHSVN